MSYLNLTTWTVDHATLLHVLKSKDLYLKGKSCHLVSRISEPRTSRGNLKVDKGLLFLYSIQIFNKIIIDLQKVAKKSSDMSCVPSRSWYNMYV